MRVCTCSMCTGRARSGKADRKLRALRAWLLAGPGGTPAGGGLVSLGSKRLVTKSIAGWIVLPVHLDVCDWVLCVRSGVCGGWEERVGLGRRSHLELKRGLHLELDGVGLLVVERRQQGDDEW